MVLTDEALAQIRDLSKDGESAEKLIALFESVRETVTPSEAALRRQNRLLADLYQVTLELLNHRDIAELLDYVVRSAIAITDSSYAEIALLEGESLVVAAASDNNYPVIGERPPRDVAVLRWKAFDSREPIVLENYQDWPARRAVYDANPIYAIAELPILLGSGCVGVLSLGRNRPNHSFTDDQIEKGVMLARLVGLIYDNARLYDEALREIAQRRRYEQQALEMASERSRAEILGMFIQHASHEFRTPLSIMQTSLYLMNRATDEESKARKAAQIGQQIGRINHLVDMLVIQAVIDSGVPLQFGPLSVYTLVHACADAVHTKLQEQSLTLELLLDEDIPLINADGERLCEALDQLFDNAVRYTLPGGKIVVRARVEGETVVIEVTDSGSGIAPDDLPHVFERFYRRDHAHSTAGFGLGLSIASKIVDLHGGRIEAESTPDAGSTFRVTVPVK